MEFCERRYGDSESSVEVSNWIRGLGMAFLQVSRGAKRSRRFRAAENFPNVASVDVLEDRLLLTADFGDAPDTTAGTGVNNYQTLAANGGPSHVIDATQTKLFLGGGVDGEAGTQQSAAANLDNLFTTGGRNDEDGVMSSMDLTATIGSSPKITLSATNTTGTAATLYGWIDYNHNGVFENATERASINVPTGATTARFTLQFPKLSGNIAGGTYARFRLSSDAAAANATGAATGGEVEDYRFQIMNPVKMPVTVTASPRISAGVNGGPEIAAEDGYGYIGLISIGDLDGNGTSDVVTGAAPLALNDDTSNLGAIYVLFRNADGSISKSVRITSDVNGGPTIPIGEHFGSAGTSLGDIDGDGIVDIAIGSINSDSNGAIYILHMKADGTVKDYKKLASGLNGVPELGIGDEFGIVASLGDIDGDGISDIAVGAPGTTGAGTNRGAVYIMRLNADGTVKSSTTIKDSASWGTSGDYSDRFGDDIYSLGDINGDGVADLVVMSEIAHGAEDSTTVINIVQLNSDGTVKHLTSLLSDTGGAPELANIQLLSSTAVIGDIDGDGINDLAVSGQEIPTANLANPFASINVIYLLTLNSDGTIKSSTRLHGPDAGTNNLYSNFTALTAIDPANGNGTFQLGVGIPLYGAEFSNTGEPIGVTSSLSVLTLASTATPTIPVLNAIVTNPGQSPVFSWSTDRHAKSYEIWLLNQTTGQVVLNSVSVSANSYSSPTALGIGNFVVWVRAVNDIGKSSWSKPRTFETKSAVSVIHTPDGLSPRPELKWQTLPGADKYEVWLSDARTPSVATIRTTTKTSATSFTPPSNLQAGTYRLWVRGVTADGSRGQWSIVDEFSVVPSTTIASITAQFSFRPTFNFSSIPGAAKYEVWINNLTTPSKPPIRITTSTSGHINPTVNLEAGNYRVWIRGIDATGKYGEWSAPRDFSAGGKPQLNSVAEETQLSATVLLHWSVQTDAARYQIWHAAPGQSPSAGQNVYDGSATNYTANQFGELGTQRFWLRAVGAYGELGAWSELLNVSATGQIYGIKVGYGREFTSRPTFRWNEMWGAATYEIKIDDTVNHIVENIHVTNLATPVFSPDADLVLGTYSLQVRGIAADGTLGQWSDVFAPTTELIPPLTVIILTTDSFKTSFTWYTTRQTFGDRFFLTDLANGRVVAEIDAYGGGGGGTAELSLRDGDYQWSMRSSGQEISEIWSTPKTFVVNHTPALSVPATYSYSSNSKLLSWSTVPAAIRYEVWIGTPSNVLKLSATYVSTNSYDIGTSLPVGEYRVWVRAVSSTVIGQWSSVGSLSIV